MGDPPADPPPACPPLCTSHRIRIAPWASWMRNPPAYTPCPGYTHNLTKTGCYLYAAGSSLIQDGKVTASKGSNGQGVMANSLVFIGEIAGFKRGGGGRSRTYEGLRRQIYSLIRLTTSVPRHEEQVASSAPGRRFQEERCHQKWTGSEDGTAHSSVSARIWNRLL